ncbi:DUF4124 domain-containing protein [Massilia sp. PAMC28688]|uniref:DUF4124 domain-containing protein n=1 Tax=Massilia sp. PAMC28688 TaxID=2861283 RepID=UPI001C62AF8E|nr:DUF4124 domain-containing protein [Massilia sp. PAMC28688]QYF95459.1 DUF4124 domain-containing protein [Massilia sp. PAMC28688]
MKNQAFLFLVIMAASSGASAQLYKTVSASGKVVYSDRPADTGASKVSVIGPVAQQAPTRASTEEEGTRRHVAGRSMPGASAGQTLHTADRGGSNGKLERMDVEIVMVSGKALVGAGTVVTTAAGVRTN